MDSGGTKRAHLIDASVAAADVDVGVVVLVVADEQLVVHQLQLLQAWGALEMGRQGNASEYNTQHLVWGEPLWLAEAFSTSVLVKQVTAPIHCLTPCHKVEVK